MKTLEKRVVHLLAMKNLPNREIAATISFIFGEKGKGQRVPFENTFPVVKWSIEERLPGRRRRNVWDVHDEFGRINRGEKNVETTRSIVQRDFRAAHGDLLRNGVRALSE